MQILIIEPDTQKQRAAIQSLHTISGITIASVCADLTGAFDEIEHRPPDLVLIAQSLTRKAEFETMEMMFRMMGLKWMAIEWSSSGRSAQQSGQNGLRFVDLSSDPQSISDQLYRRQCGLSRKLPESSVGLLRSPTGSNKERLVLIGSSTGGVDALLRVLGSFPKDCPPTLIVQHTGSSFSKGLAKLLDRNIAPDVAEAEDGQPIKSGQILIAPGSETHLTVEGRHNFTCRLVASDRVAGHRPSVDVLFKSATPIAPRVTAAILTGMGKDGGNGLLELRKAGAFTIGQDSESSVVYGMPRYAAEIGAVAKVLPITAIGPAILRSTMAVAA